MQLGQMDSLSTSPVLRTRGFKVQRFAGADLAKAHTFLMSAAWHNPPCLASQASSLHAPACLASRGIADGAPFGKAPRGQTPAGALATKSINQNKHDTASAKLNSKKREPKQHCFDFLCPASFSNWFPGISGKQICFFLLSHVLSEISCPLTCFSLQAFCFFFGRAGASHAPLLS